MHQTERILDSPAVSSRSNFDISHRRGTESFIITELAQRSFELCGEQNCTYEQLSIKIDSKRYNLRVSGLFS